MIKTLGKYVGKYKKHSILAPVFVVLEALTEIIIPFLTSDMVDQGIDKGETSCWQKLL